MSGPDDIERRLREIEAEIGPAQVKEPSAAERARQAARKPNWRARRKARKLRRPVPEPGRKSSRRRHRLRPVLITVVVLACVAGAAFAVLRLGQHLPRFSTADNVPVTRGPTPSGSPAGPGSSLPAPPTLAAPFLGSPAQSYADGAAGIVVPPARPVGRFSTGQVAAAYQMTKSLLIAANLNRPTLAGQAPDAFASLLLPQQRSYFVDHLDQIGVDSRGYAKSTRGWVVSFAPGTSQLVGNVIKVHGSMRASVGPDGSLRVLRIHVDFLFVYAAEQPGVPSTLMRLVSRDYGYVFFYPFTGPGAPLEPWWQVLASGVAGSRCDVNDGFVHPGFRSGPPDKVPPTGAPVNPYDQSVPPPATGGCRMTTGT